jgi:hypothetical protein
MRFPFWRCAKLGYALPILAAAILAVSDVTAQEGAIAVTLATGAGVEALQHRVDLIEERAIAKRPFSDDDKAFLRDLYGAMAEGAKRSVVLAQSGRLMERYLDRTGDPCELDARIFSRNSRVRREVERLASEMSAPTAERARTYRTPRFYMPDASSLDSVTGLYWGTVEGTVRSRPDGSIVFHYRATVPWEWPSYEELRRRYGTPHAETFPLPNARSALFGDRYALRVENGLGEYLVRLGLARPFLAWAEWDEPAPLR